MSIKIWTECLKDLLTQSEMYGRGKKMGNHVHFMGTFLNIVERFQKYIFL